VTADDFRNLALSLPETSESAHMGHPDFRVHKKIFATLGVPDKACGMAKLTPQQQAGFVAEHPQIFEPVAGGWGRQGATIVHLPDAIESIVRRALVAAWRNTAPKRLSQQFSDD
jgi:hypothetical protein